MGRGPPRPRRAGQSGGGRFKDGGEKVLRWGWRAGDRREEGGERSGREATRRLAAGWRRTVETRPRPPAAIDRVKRDGWTGGGPCALIAALGLLSGRVGLTGLWVYMLPFWFLCFFFLLATREQS
jgi:hypothetical protein